MLRRALLLLLLLSSPLLTRAAALSLSPSAGTFTTGSTFDVSVFLNSGGQSVNAISAQLQFPPDKLQLVSPTVGKSIIGVWITAPQFNNQTGQLSLEGVVPNGIRTDQGLLTTLTFRVKSVGQAVVKFSSQSKVLLNDGVGTDALNQIQNAIYQLALPPPAGPLVTSETHPDQTKWYPNANATLTWAANEPDVQGYSYVLNDEPIDLPDDISEGPRTGVSYKNLTEGRHYFHVKALRSGNWGETTHFALLIDKTPPADFPVEILPDPRTSSHQPVIQFATTDTSSGLDHYELRIIALQSVQQQPLFIESGSPYVPQSLTLGDYDVVVRAYDVAGNYREVTKRLSIVTPLFRFISDHGLVIGERIIISWPWLWLIAALLLLLLGYLASRLRFLHLHLSRQHESGELPAQVADQLNELQKYRERYGKALVIILLLGGLGRAEMAWADTNPLTPPIVTTISRQISNQEIFYVGGRDEAPNGEVLIYLQNPATGELTSERVATNNDGNWFYRHNTFLATGNYLIWTQTKRDNELSPPGPQLELSVESRALQFGASRLSYEAIDLLIIIILLGALIFLITDIIIHWRRIKRRRALLSEEIRQAEESVRRGFAVLRRDIETELQSTREKTAREKLLADLQRVEKYIGKEIWDVEKVGYNK